VANGTWAFDLKSTGASTKRSAIDQGQLSWLVAPLFYQVLSETGFAPPSWSCVSLDTFGPVNVITQRACGDFWGADLELASSQLLPIALLGYEVAGPISTWAGMVIELAVADQEALEAAWEGGLTSGRDLLRIVRKTLRQDGRSDGLLSPFRAEDLVASDLLLTDIAQFGAGLRLLPSTKAPLAISATCSSFPELARDIPKEFFAMRPRALVPPFAAGGIAASSWERFRERVDELHELLLEFWFDEKSASGVSRWDLLGFDEEIDREAEAKKYLKAHVERIKGNSAAIEAFAARVVAEANLESGL
jgi:hypothetical protein